MDAYPPPEPEVIEACIAAFIAERHRIAVFGNSVREFLTTHPQLNSGNPPAIHSVRYRVKDETHLRQKIVRKKVKEDRHITAENIFQQVTDLAGVRVLHLHQLQFAEIHAIICDQIDAGHWCAFEPPKAFTWDPELTKHFESLGLETVFRETHYTSVHYVIKPNENLPTTCEIQVRTLFEEVWAEIDHVLNYPEPTDSVACKEQLRVMSKLAGAGSRLAEAIFRSHNDYVAGGTPTSQGVVETPSAGS